MQVRSVFVFTREKKMGKRKQKERKKKRSIYYTLMRENGAHTAMGELTIMYGFN